MVHPIRTATAELDHVLKSVADLNPTFMENDDKAAALTELAGIEARVTELRLRIAADAGDVAERTGARDLGAWAAATHHRRPAVCRAEQRLAVALPRLPVLASALREGVVHVEQAHAIARALDELPSGLDESVRAEAEAELVRLAADFDATELRRLGRRILDLVAPEIAEAAEARHLAALESDARDAMRLGLRSLGNGTARISGVIPDTAAARLATYLHAFTNPRRDRSPADEAGEPGRAPVVPYGKRTAQAFCQLLECLDPGRLPIHGGDATTLVVTMSLESLRSELGTALLGSTAPGDSHDRITAHEARRLACTAGIIPAVLGSDGELLDLGRSQRLFSRAQNRALALRHPTCMAEGCSIPAPWTEAHHVIPWSRGGPTDLDNAANFCSHHHHRAHDPAYTTSRSASGLFQFHRRQ